MFQAYQLLLKLVDISIHISRREPHAESIVVVILPSSSFPWEVHL